MAFALCSLAADAVNATLSRLDSSGARCARITTGNRLSAEISRGRDAVVDTERSPVTAGDSLAHVYRQIVQTGEWSGRARGHEAATARLWRKFAVKRVSGAPLAGNATLDATGKAHCIHNYFIV